MFGFGSIVDIEIYWNFGFFKLLREKDFVYFNGYRFNVRLVLGMFIFIVWIVVVMLGCVIGMLGERINCEVLSKVFCLCGLSFVWIWFRLYFLKFEFFCDVFE